MNKDFITTNISITPKQREKLRYKEKITGKKMAELIREAIDKVYPDPIEPTPVILLQEQYRSGIVEEKEDYRKDVESISSGLTEDVYNRLFKK